jgi:SulP family sulfate permease
VLVLWQFALPRFLPQRVAKALALVPGAMLVLVLATLFSELAAWPVATLGSRFGSIPTGLPPLVWPTLSWSAVQSVLPASFTLALMGGIESLLCARVADSMIDDRHNPNQELMAQGLANLAMPFIGGMPATGTIARTVTNVKNGANSPVAGMVHALGLLLMVLLAAPWVAHIPIGALSAILMLVAYNMGEWRAFAQLGQFRWPYRLTLLAVFALTVLVDLTVAIEVGLLAACLTFVYRISGLTHSIALHQSPQVQVWGLQGALFFGAVNLLEELSLHLPQKALVLDCSGLIYMDSSGADALHSLWRSCQQAQVRLVLTGLNPQSTDLLRRTQMLELLGADNLQPHWADTLKTLAG